MDSFDSVTSLAILILAAIIHASFQMSVSVLTLMSGHALGRQTARRRLVHLIDTYVLGAGVLTVLLLSTLAYFLSLFLPPETPGGAWALASGAVVGVGVSVWLFYYRKERGTTLWVPRAFTEFLADRAKHTKSGAESFGLGMTSVVAELLFLFAPMVVAALVLIRLDPALQAIAVGAYAAITMLPLLVIAILIGRGYKLSRIQKWRESNKRFLQFAAGSALIILGMFIYVEQVMTMSVVAGVN